MNKAFYQPTQVESMKKLLKSIIFQSSKNILYLYVNTRLIIPPNRQST
jgi:hypothetical protein